MNQDQQFDQNLNAAGAAGQTPASPDPLLIEQCMDTLAKPAIARKSFFARPAVLSTLGMAASIFALLTFLNPWGGAPRVEAATVLAKLNEQISENPLLEITIDSLVTDDLQIDGQFLVVNDAAVGQLEVVSNLESGDLPLDINMEFALSEGTGWVLVRNLQIPEPQAAMIAQMFLPPGRETLVMLPEDMGDGSPFQFDVQTMIQDITSNELRDILTQLEESQDELGATVDELPDGALRFRLPIENASVLERLKVLHEDAMEDSDAEDREESEDVHKRIGATPDNVKDGFQDHLRVMFHGSSEVGESHDADEEADGDTKVEVNYEFSFQPNLEEEEEEPEGSSLIGSTIEIIYDPAKEIVREITILDLGSGEGRISVQIREGEIDPARFDESRVTDGMTHVLDLDKLMKMFDH